MSRGVGHFYRQRSEKIIELLIEIISNLKLKKILDIGCGAGWYLKKLERMGDTIGLDFCMNYLSQARDFCKKSLFINADAQRLPFRNNYFDLILCTEVLEHLPFPCQCLKEIARVLSKNGVAVITTPMKNSIEEIVSRKNNPRHNVEHLSIFTYKEFIFTLKKNFTLRRIEATSFIPLNKITYLLYKQQHLIKIINSICSKIRFLKNFSWCVIAIVTKRTDAIGQYKED